MGRIIKLDHWWKQYRKGREGDEWPTAPERLKALLRNEKAPFRVIPHSEAFTSPELAASIHATGRRVAKVVMVKADERYVMAVLPSHLHLDLDRLAPLLGTRRVALATEAEIGKLFPDCELGAMPPFGSLYGLRVFLDRSLTREPEIYFQAGTHHEVIEMAYEDFERLVRPEVGDFARSLKKASGF
ncbi:MAG: YbaK/EbsC family protein [Nitrospirae bacterium]|nr:YbaK/EbsC family protein [Nitrospirota bacterium]